MADQTINAETTASSAAAGDKILIWVDASGFQRAITKANFIGAILSGGGTIATGGFSLTLGANSALSGAVEGDVSGGGTIATGGFTGTLPADGIFALLGTANVFTTNQTVNSTATTGNALLVTRNQSAGDGAVVSIVQDHASNAQAALLARQDGTGDIAAFYDAGNAAWRLLDGGNVVMGTVALASGLNGILIGAAATRTVAIGQDTTHALLVSWIYNATAGNAYAAIETYGGSNPLRLQSNGGNVAVGVSASTYGKLNVKQDSATGAMSVLTLDQVDLSEEFFRFGTTIGAGNPINTTALGTYYGRIRIYVEGVGEKWLAAYNT